MAILAFLSVNALIIYGLYRLFCRLLGRGRERTPLLAAEGFTPTIMERTCAGRAAVALDTVGNRVMVAGPGYRRVINMEGIIAVEALINGVSAAQGGGQASMVGGAVMGELVAGPLGALAGAAMAGSRVQSLSLRLLTDDLAEPWVEVPFMASRVPLFRSDRRVQAILPVWRAWEGRFLTIVARQPIVVARSRPDRASIA